jgi:predicted site-specific integrase-resolvase
VLLSLSAAARRVGRNRRTIHRWIRAGMPTVVIRDAEYRVVRHVVDEEVLLAWYRRALMQDPTRASQGE